VETCQRISVQLTLLLQLSEGDRDGSQEVSVRELFILRKYFVSSLLIFHCLFQILFLVVDLGNLDANIACLLGTLSKVIFIHFPGVEQNGERSLVVLLLRVHLSDDHVDLSIRGVRFTHDLPVHLQGFLE